VPCGQGPDSRFSLEAGSPALKFRQPFPEFSHGTATVTSDGRSVLLRLQRLNRFAGTML
jgi:hypothetical protein